jgi:hypothetical protein
MFPIVALALLLADPAPALPPSEISISEISSDWAGSSATWTIDAMGRGEIWREHCRRCAINRAISEPFQVSPDVFENVMRALNRDALAAAVARPCTLPNGSAHGHAVTRVSVRIVSPHASSIEEYSHEHYELFKGCQSADMAAAIEAIEAAKMIISAGISADLAGL